MTLQSYWVTRQAVPVKLPWMGLREHLMESVGKTT